MAEDKSLTEGEKWMISLWSGLLFLIIASPLAYMVMGALFRALGLNIEKDGCPYISGLIIHAIVFAILIRVMMLIPLPGTGHDDNNKKKKDTYVAVHNPYSHNDNKDESKFYNSYSGYTGLANPGIMMRCNTAQIAAENKGCNVCAKAAQTCMMFPREQMCKNAMKMCMESDCKSDMVKKAIQNNCHILPHIDYFPKGPSCTA